MTLWSDIRLAIRGFRRNPGFSAVVAATIALGVGGNAAIFSVVDSILFRPLPIAQAERIVRLHDTRRSPDGTVTRFNISDGHFLEIARRARSFEVIAAQRGDTRTLLGAEPERVTVVNTSPGTWNLFGVAPARGRVFTEAEERSGANVALISHELWERRFSSDPRILDRILPLEGRPLSVVGVLPPGFRFPYDASVWIPAVPSENGHGEWAVFARRKPDVTIAAARAEIEAVAGVMHRDVGGTGPGYGIDIADFRTSLQDDRARIAVTLLALVSLFLLIACTNAAILLLARALGMRRELAIRFALGASVIRQGRRLVTESIVLALAGGIAGVLLAVWLDRFLRVLIPSNFTDQLGLPAGRLDLRILTFGLVASLLVGALAGLAPLFRLSRHGSEELLRTGARAGDARRDRRLFATLAAGEIALSIVLLFGAGTMIGQFRGLSRRKLGFDPSRVWTIRLTIPPREADGPSRDRYLAEVLREASAVATVESAGATTVNPLGPGGTWENPVQPEGAAPGTGAYSVNARFVTPDLFRAMGIQIMAGRSFTPLDRAGAEPVAIVSASLARRFWPRSSAIGRKVRRDADGESWRTVVGVAGDVADTGDLAASWYLPFAQEAGISGAENLHLMLRAPAHAAGIPRAVEAAVHRFDANLPLFESARMDRVRSEALSQERLGAISVALFAALGLVLAELGTFGIVSYAVNRRAREFAIRLAVGAAPARLLRGVVGDGLRVAAWGVGAGVLLAAAGARGISALLATPEAAPATFLLGAAILTGVITAVATLIPARRASTVDPASALREE